MEEEKKSYYAIIPANVRYDEEITANAKLLYGEITALCNEKGYCWASNEYFAKLYGVSNRCIINWINSLIDAGYLDKRFEYKTDSKVVDKRYLYIADGSRGGEKIFTGVVKKFSRGGEKIFTDNNTSNNTSNNKYIVEIQQIVDFLNEVCGTKYRATTESTKRNIRARLNDGFTVDDFKVVINKKHDEWAGTEMEKYLSPDTLFGNKFEKYLNQKGVKNRRKEDISSEQRETIIDVVGFSV